MKILFSYVTVLLLNIVFTGANGYNILGVFPHAAQSHFNIFGALMEQLAVRGHNVTVISYFPKINNTFPNYHDISLIGTGPILINALEIQTNTKHTFKNFFEHMRIAQSGLASCQILGSSIIKKFLNANPSFDVIIQEHYNTDCFLALNYLLKAPSIGITSCTLHPWLLDRSGVPVNPSYIPVNLFEHSVEMSFFERVQNTLGYFIHGHILKKLWMDYPSNNLMRQYFGSEFPLLENIARNTSLYLINTHYTINSPRSLPPNVVEVSGLHLSKPKKLPQDIQKFIDESDQGVIYFSFGSMMKGSSIPEKDRMIFLDAFRHLPQRVLWKFENESLQFKPDNVMIRQWMPQFDILNHPNVKAFISHGGLLGCIESVHAGVPAVPMPFYNEQYINAKALELSGVAKVVRGDSFTKEDIVRAIETVLEPSVQERAKQLSQIFKDRPMLPMDTSIWWIEYVARSRGAKNLRTAVVDMPLYQSMLLDVAAFLLSMIFICLCVFYKFIRIVLEKFVISEKIKRE